MEPPVGTLLETRRFSYKCKLCHCNQCRIHYYHKLRGSCMRLHQLERSYSSMNHQEVGVASSYFHYCRDWRSSIHRQLRSS